MSWTNHNDYTGATIAIRNASSHEVARKYLEDFCAERDAVEDAEWARLEAENAKYRAAFEGLVVEIARQAGINLTNLRGKEAA